MLKNRWVVFVLQAVAVAVIWAAFLALVARHQLDGWFWGMVIGVALIVPTVYLWRSSHRAEGQAAGERQSSRIPKSG